MDNFSFVIPEILSGAARPGCSLTLAEDISQMKEHGIGVVVSLTESTLDVDIIRGNQLEYHHLPVHDFTPPSQEQFRKFYQIVEDAKNDKKGAVLVHCAAGVGRTGTMLAAYLIANGQTTQEAVNAVRKSRPGSIETQSQINSLKEWEAQLAKSK